MYILICNIHYYFTSKILHLLCCIFSSNFKCTLSYKKYVVTVHVARHQCTVCDCARASTSHPNFNPDAVRGRVSIVADIDTPNDNSSGYLVGNRGTKYWAMNEDPTFVLRGNRKINFSAPSDSFLI